MYFTHFSQIVVSVLSAACLVSAGVLQGPSSSATVVGPDGSVINAYAPGGQVAVPDAVPYAAPGLLVAPAAPAVAAYIPVTVAPTAADSEGQYVPDDEGQYVPDNTEQQFEDGSYKGE